MKKYLLGTLVTTALLAAGCGSSSNAGSCERIVEACHDKDTGSGEPHDCHEAAEAADATDDTCADIEDSCLAACK
jgi:hypothetical protein